MLAQSLQQVLKELKIANVKVVKEFIKPNNCVIVLLSPYDYYYNTIGTNLHTTGKTEILTHLKQFRQYSYRH